FIGAAIRDEGAYRALYGDLVADAEDILVRIEELEALEADETDEEKWVCSDMEHIRARAEEIYDDAFATQSASDAVLLTLENLAARYAIASIEAQYSSEAAEEQIRITEEFMNLQANGLLHSSITIARDEFEVEETANELDELASELETLCRIVPRRGDKDDDDKDRE
ncbi:MAG: hypothetical protein U1A28_01750, partial [Patescibacteria group bacterium]|nr:hypothetical protein [Patescibacteria group bacterium]